MRKPSGASSGATSRQREKAERAKRATLAGLAEIQRVADLAEIQRGLDRVRQDVSDLRSESKALRDLVRSSLSVSSGSALDVGERELRAARDHRMLHSRQEAAEELSIHVSSLDVLINQGRIRVRHMGRRVLIPHAELERFAKRDQAPIWPPKRDGKTTTRWNQERGSALL
jgi:excisionase family DNA binding protein